MALPDPNLIAPPVTATTPNLNPEGISGGIIQTNLGAVTPPTTTASTPPLQPIAPVAGYTAATGQAGTSAATGYQSTPYTVADEGLVQSRIKSLVAEDSPLMQQARTRAAQEMNARGLVNSSLGIQAGQQAVISNAMPIAQSDAQSINAAMTNTANARNTASQFNASAENAASSLNAQLLTTMNQANANSQNAAMNQTAVAANARSLAFIDNNSKQSLATLQAQNQQLLQANANASSMFGQVVQNISAISQNPQLNDSAKRLAIDSQLNLLNEGLRASAEISSTDQAAVTGLNLDQYFEAPSKSVGILGKPTTLAQANEQITSITDQIKQSEDNIAAIQGAYNRRKKSEPQLAYDLDVARLALKRLQEQLAAINVAKETLS